jgi:hypothetical protein
VEIDLPKAAIKMIMSPPLLLWVPSVMQQEDWCSLIATLRCVAGLQLPMACVSSVSVLLLLLHVSLWARHVYLPIQVSIYVIAWARTVISIQLLKVRISMELAGGS